MMQWPAAALPVHAGRASVSVSVIGGADGPMAIFLAADGGSWPLAVIAAVLAVAAGLFLFIRGNK